MKRVLSSAFLIIIAVAFTVLAAPLVRAQTSTTDDLTRLLKEFLDGAGRNDAAMHDRFWADDVIYTGSAGRRRGKADIMRDVRSAPVPKAGDPTTTYGAEEIRVQQYGNAAVVAFRLVSTRVTSGGTEVTNYLNSGTFVKRNGRWQVVNWQSTRMPAREEPAAK